MGVDCEKCGGKETAIWVDSFGNTKNPFAYSWYECQKCGCKFPTGGISGWVIQGNKRHFFNDRERSLCGKLLVFDPWEDCVYPKPYPIKGRFNLLHPDNCPECVEVWIKKEDKQLSEIGGLYDFLWELEPSLKGCANECDRFTRLMDNHSKQKSCEFCNFYQGGIGKVCLMRTSQNFITEMFEKETANSKENWKYSDEWEREEYGKEED